MAYRRENALGLPPITLTYIELLINIANNNTNMTTSSVVTRADYPNNIPTSSFTPYSEHTSKACNNQYTS